MIYLWIVLGLLLVLIVSLLFLKARVVLEYNNGYFRVIFRSGLIRISIDSKTIERLTSKNKKKEKPERKKAETQEKEPHEKFFDKVKKIKQKYLSIKTVANIFLRCVRYKVSFSKIYIRVHYGTGDAASTGMLYGAIWALIGNVYGFICRYFNISFPEVDLDADYNKKVFETEVKGIITVRPVHIIIAVLRSLRAYKKEKRAK